MWSESRPAWLRVISRNGSTSFGSRRRPTRSEEHTSELQSQSNLVCRLLLEKKKKMIILMSNHQFPPGNAADRYSRLIEVAGVFSSQPFKSKTIRPLTLFRITHIR